MCRADQPVSPITGRCSTRPLSRSRASKTRERPLKANVLSDLTWWRGTSVREGDTMRSIRKSPPDITEVPAWAHNCHKDASGVDRTEGDRTPICPVLTHELENLCQGGIKCTTQRECEVLISFSQHFSPFIVSVTHIHRMPRHSSYSQPVCPPRQPVPCNV